MAKRSRVAVLASLGLCSVALPTCVSRNNDGGAVDLEGRPADPFQMAGRKITVFFFVRTDCPVSNRYAPTIQELSRRYAERAAFFLIYPIKSETPEQIRKHVHEFGYQLPALRDPGLTLARASQVTITPEVAVFVPGRKLLYHGRIDDWYVEFTKARSAPTTHDLADSLDAAIAGKLPPTRSAPAVGCFIPGLT